MNITGTTIRKYAQKMLLYSETKLYLEAAYNTIISVIPRKIPFFVPIELFHCYNIQLIIQSFSDTQSATKIKPFPPGDFFS